MRAETPVFFDETWDLTFFTRHAHVAGILKDRRFGRDVRSVVPADELDPQVARRTYPPHLPEWTKYIRGSFIDLEPPRHTRIRRLVQWAFTRRASESYRQRLVTTADTIVEEALGQSRMEAIADFATPIPLTMIAELLGVPAADQDRLVAWSHAIVRVFDEGHSPAEGMAGEVAVKDFAAYVRELLADRRAHPGDDLVSALIKAEHDGDRLDEDELVATCILTLNAGHEATVHGIGNALLALSRNDAEFRRLQSQPDLVTSAADEVLRFDSPLQMFERWVLEDLELAGVRLKRGHKVGLLFGSANHDEAVFANSETLDVGRVDNPHVSFGGGIHYCVGAPLAKIELEVALSSFARQVGAFTVEGTPDRVRSLVFRGMNELPLAISRR
ncbi:MAG TPA: cytochrome P450 [Acidimicrobiia bacterium]|nr:cytochrome P450 [Acidimicrobiia bacterium]